MFNAEKVTKEIIAWIKNYFKANGNENTKAVIGISGGKDSSVVAALCVAALGKERVLGVLMPQGVQEDIDVAYDLCKTLGIEYKVVNIKKAVDEMYAELRVAGVELNSIVTTNNPARVRMAMLYAVSGSVGGRVSNNCNKSERWVGYETKGGDNIGDFAPIEDLTVTEVLAVGRVIGLESRFIDKVPIDGLCGKSDEENLGFSYAVLDRYIREKVCEDAAVRERIDWLHRTSDHKRKPIQHYVLDVA